jgi:hypothetical protein
MAEKYTSVKDLDDLKAKLVFERGPVLLMDWTCRHVLGRIDAPTDVHKPAVAANLMKIFVAHGTINYRPTSV